MSQDTMGASHSHVNTIANAYPDDIWVKTSTDIAYTTLTDTSVGMYFGKPGVEVHHHDEYDWERCEKEGFTRVEPGKYIGMHPNTHDTDTVYVTLIGSNGRIFAHNYPTTKDGGVIATRRGYLEESQHGKPWTDLSGKVHDHKILLF